MPVCRHIVKFLHATASFWGKIRRIFGINYSGKLRRSSKKRSLRKIRLAQVVHKEKIMQYVIAVYRSRNVTMQAYNFLTQHGVVAALISTPRSVNVGCGLSVKFSVDVLPRVRATLSAAETFVGFFAVRNTMSGTIVTQV